MPDQISSVAGDLPDFTVRIPYRNPACVRRGLEGLLQQRVVVRRYISSEGPIAYLGYQLRCVAGIGQLGRYDPL